MNTKIFSVFPACGKTYLYEHQDEYGLKTLLVKKRYWKDKRIRELESENEKLKDIIRSNKELCRSCKGHDEKSPNYGYTKYCEDCFWYPWADEEKCPNKWELKEDK